MPLKENYVGSKAQAPNQFKLYNHEIQIEFLVLIYSYPTGDKKADTFLPMQLPQLHLPEPPSQPPPPQQFYPPQQYQPSQILQQAIKQLNQQDFSKPIANLQSVPVSAANEEPIGLTLPVSSQPLGGRTQSPIGTPRDGQSPIGTPRSIAANPYSFPPHVGSRPGSHPSSRSQSPSGIPHQYIPSRQAFNQPNIVVIGDVPSEASGQSSAHNAANRVAAGFKPLDSTSQRSSPEIVVIGSDSRPGSRCRERYNSVRSSEDDRQSDSEVSMYWRQALKSTGLLRAAGEGPRASPPIPAHPQGHHQHNQHNVSQFKPIPQVQRLTPPIGQSMWNRGETVESPTLRGHYRVPSPMLANFKPKGWQYVPYQDQNDTKGIELLITNLDYQMDRRELKRHLVGILSEHCKVSRSFFISFELLMRNNNV